MEINCFWEKFSSLEVTYENLFAEKTTNFSGIVLNNKQVDSKFFKIQGNKIIGAGFTFEIKANKKEVVLTKYDGEYNNVKIGEILYVNGQAYKIVELGEKCFGSLYDLQSITLPDNIEYIYQDDYDGFKNLTVIVSSKEKSFTEISKYLEEYSWGNENLKIKLSDINKIEDLKNIPPHKIQNIKKFIDNNRAKIIFGNDNTEINSNQL